MSRTLLRTSIALVLFAPMLPATASAAMTEYTVVRVDPVSFTVTAQASGSGEQIEFKLPASSFHGQKFNADLERVGAGQKFSAQGAANSKVGGAQSTGGRGFGSGGPGFGSGGGFPGAGSGGGFPGAGSGGPDAGFGRQPDPRQDSRRDSRGRGGQASGQSYQVSRVVGTPTGFDITAQGQGGESIQFTVAASAFDGYRFTVDSESLARGGGFDIVAPNTESLRDCCTLTSTGR